MPTSRRSTLLALLGLTALALALRFVGLGFGLPMAIELDCKIPRQVELLESGASEPERDPDFRWYPLFLAQIARAWPSAQPAPLDAPIEAHLAAAARPHWQTRATVALVSVLLVPGTFLLARMFLSAPWSLFAAALSALSLLGLNFSQQSRPHAAAASLFLWTVLVCVRLRRRGDLASYALAGAALALSLGTLQSAVLLLPALVVAHLLRGESAGSLARRVLDPRVLLPLGLALVSLRVFSPFLFGSAAELGAGKGVVNLSGHRVYLHQFNGKGFGVVLHTLWSYEPVLLALATLGACVLLARKARATIERRHADRRDLAVVMSFALPYFLAIGAYERTYERFVLPLIPYLACLAAFGVACAVSALVRRAPLARARIASIGTALALLALPTFACAKLAWIRAAPNTTERAADWVRAHIERSDKILLTSQLDLPLWREREGLVFWGKPIEDAFFLVWSRYQARLPGGEGPEPRYRLSWFPLTGANVLQTIVRDPDTYLREQEGDWAVAEVFAENRAHPAGTRLREALLRNGELVARISPDGRENYSDHPFGVQDETSVTPPHFLARVLQAQGVGPVIEIFRLRKDGAPR